MITRNNCPSFRCYVLWDLPVIYIWPWIYDFLQRITVPEILEDEWFKKGYKPPVFEENYDANLDDVDAAFRDSEVSRRRASMPIIVKSFTMPDVIFLLDSSRGFLTVCLICCRNTMWQRKRKNNQQQWMHLNLFQCQKDSILQICSTRSRYKGSISIRQNRFMW